jgi:hypothetical protein
VSIEVVVEGLWLAAHDNRVRVDVKACCGHMNPRIAGITAVPAAQLLV